CWGTDQVSCWARSVGVERSYKTFTEAAKEGGKSRVFAGIHWSFDVAIGEQVGRKIGQYVVDHYFQPLPGGPSLVAAAAAPAPVTETLRSEQVQPLLAEALSRWQASGIDTAALLGVDIRIADLGGLTLGKADGGILWLDDNAAGWGWFVDATPCTDSEFTTPGDQGEAGRMDLLTVLEHEIGHLLGKDHEDGGVMADALAPGIRRTPTARDVGDWSAIVDLLSSPARMKPRL